jgi:hypothetical protein
LSRNIVADSVQVAKLLVASAHAQNLIMSKKSAIVPTPKQLTTEIPQRLFNEGITIMAQDTTRDLGLDAGAGVRRRTSIFTARAAKGKMRVLKIGFLQRVTSASRSKRFFGSNIWPASSYGAAAYGSSEARLQSLRSLAAKSIQQKAGQCATSVIALGLGQHKEPLVLQLRQAVGFWLETWQTADVPLKRSLTSMWCSEKTQLTRFDRTIIWGKVTGPLRTLLAMLLRIGWGPVLPTLWKSEDLHGWSDHAFTGAGDSTMLFNAVTTSAALHYSTLANKHWSGSSKLGGCFYEGARAHIKYLEKSDPGEAALLMVMCSGAT